MYFFIDLCKYIYVGIHMLISLDQWFSTRHILPFPLLPLGIFGNVWRHFPLSQLVGGRVVFVLHCRCSQVYLGSRSEQHSLKTWVNRKPDIWVFTVSVSECVSVSVCARAQSKFRASGTSGDSKVPMKRTMLLMILPNREHFFLRPRLSFLQV